MRTIHLASSLYRRVQNTDAWTVHHALRPRQRSFNPVGVGNELYDCIRRARAFSSSVSETKQDNGETTTSKNNEDVGTANSNSTTKYGKYQPRPWRSYYEALKNFQAEHNHCNVPQRMKADPSLAYFVGKQRRLGRDKLTPQQVADLDALGFDWETRAERYERQWNEKLELLLTYQKEHDTLNVPRRSTYGDGSLGAWVDKQRVLKKQGLLLEERQKRLDAIGFEWTVVTTSYERKTTTHDKKWLKKYKQLADFYRQHGHTLIPARYDKDLSLGNWIVAQRSLNRKGILRQDRKELLHAIDFCFEIDNTDPTVSVNQQRWEENFELLLEHKKQNGHMNVPHREGKLGEWIATQKKAEKDGTLDDSRRKRLLQAGFHFSKSREEMWQDQYEKLMQFHQQHGHTMVPKNNGDVDGDRTLANWIMNQRALFREGKLSTERRQKLDALDFVWQVRSASKGDPEKEDEESNSGPAAA